jgi:Rrf2 family protein
MKLQKSTRLALCSVLEIAANPERALSAGEIAQKYGVSTHHLSKVLCELARAQIVESARGVGGGYRLTGNAKRLTLMGLIELFEDIGAGAPEGGTDVERALATVLSEVDETARATFRSITVDTMLKLIQFQQRIGKGSLAVEQESSGRTP